MKPSLLKLSRQAGDAHIGQTLLRLATLAAAAHQHEALATQRDLGQMNADQLIRANPQVQLQQAGTDAWDSGGTVHTEVDR